MSDIRRQLMSGHGRAGQPLRPLSDFTVTRTFPQRRLKISALRGHPHYSPYAIHATITLDGEAVRDSFAADEAAGTVECYARDDSGNFIIEHNKIKTITLRGKVVITAKEEFIKHFLF